LIEVIDGTVFTNGDNAYPNGVSLVYKVCYGLTLDTLKIGLSRNQEITIITPKTLTDITTISVPEQVTRQKATRAMTWAPAISLC